MKVYVSEIPKSCKECNLSWCRNCRANYKLRCETCPLQSLSDYTKQVRKEVYQELKNKILYCSERIFEDGHYYYGKELDEIIDQIQGE